jgi:GNAT superfamily N-acetyltransferase
MLFVDLSLARRLEAAEAITIADYVEALQQLRPESTADVIDVGGGYAGFLMPDTPVNVAAGVGTSEAVHSSVIDHIEAFYESHDAPPRIAVCPLGDIMLPTLLGERRYAIVQFFNKHVRSLSRTEGYPAPARGVTVQEIDADGFDLWAWTARGPEASTGKTEMLVDARERILTLADLCPRRANVRCYLGYLDGKVAGNCAMHIHDGLATLFYTSTLPEHRRQGVHTAMIYHRLAAAAAAGCDMAVVAPIPGTHSESSLQKAGFRVAYTRMVMQRTQ